MSSVMAEGGVCFDAKIDLLVDEISVLIVI